MSLKYLSVLIAATCLGLTVHAESTPPLSAQEQAALIAEIQAMVKTDENKVTEFVVKEATPERIEHLYRTPEFLRQPKSIREHGLIFAGRGKLLSFAKPSDVIGKVSSWFPDEMAKARAKKDKRLWLGDVHLQGPFENWEPEPAAFLALWNCVPQGVWLRPERNPFERRLDDWSSHHPIVFHTPSEEESDFAFCLRERSGYRSGWTNEQARENRASVRNMAMRITPILTGKFSRFLTANRCRGRGPDDCVLVLRMWASLAPAEAELAAALRTLEAEIAPDGPLPELHNPAADWSQSLLTDGQDRFDEGLRRAAFLRAKLVSVLNAPQAWPSDALATTLQQMTNLRQAFAVIYVHRWHHYDIKNRNDPISPWQVLMSVPAVVPLVRSAIMSELDRTDPATDCEVFQHWYVSGGPALEATYALQKLTAKQPLRCASPQWAWLKEGKTEEARNLRDVYISLANRVTSGDLREKLFAEFTNHGDGCFTAKAGDTPSWVRDICNTWISEPQTVPFTLKHSKLALEPKKRFRLTKLQPPETITTDAVVESQDKWLAALVPGMAAPAAQMLLAYAVDLRKRDVHVLSAKVWRHPRHASSLIELNLIRGENTHVVLAAGPLTLTVANIPQRFRSHRNEIVRVSDLDEDGNLELWWAESFYRCDGDQKDLERELDCTAKTADMGEIQGDILSYFVKSEALPVIRLAMASVIPSTIASAAPDVAREEDQPCNTILIGAVLEDKLDLDFGGGELNGGRGDVIGVVCKPHPLHPEQTLVALFHDLKDKPGENGQDKKGFVFAVIDVKRKWVHRVYRDTIEEDASIRISDYSLKIDTARYNLAPGVRALGVRMNIGYSPRCAEGGESNYLTLFVEDGKRLKPVLKDMAMSRWSITEGSNSCGNAETEYTTDNVTLTLSVLPTVNEGWHDLEVTAHHQLETTNAAAETPGKQEAKAQVLGKLRAKGKTYQADSVWSQIWP